MPARCETLFPLGVVVRYRPGFGTYGYEDVLEPDGRVPGVVVGHSRTRVRVRFTMQHGRQLVRGVDPGSLVLAVLA